MSKIKNIFITILAAAALAPAPARAMIIGTATDMLDVTPVPFLSQGATAYLMNTYQWQNDDWNNEGNIARDADGFVYMAGTFNTNPGVQPSNTSVFVRKISASGSVVWTTTFTLTTSAYARGAALDGQGNLYVLARGADSTIYVSKLHKDSGIVQGGKISLSGGMYSDAYDIGADADGAYVAGTVGGNASILFFAADFSANGSTASVRSYSAMDASGYSANSSAYAIDVNGQVGRIALAGTVYNGSYGNDIWAASYKKSDLSLVWASTYAPVDNHPLWGYDEAHGVKIDKSSNVYVTGFYYSQNTGSDIFLGKFDPSGNLAFSRTKNGPSNGYDKGFGVALDAFGNIYVAGKMEAYSSGQGDNIWVGKFPPGGGMPSEVIIHRGQESAYDVEAGSVGVVIGGGFEDKYGILNIPQNSFGEPQLLTAGPGYHTGTVNLSWMFETAGNYNYRIQYSTSPAGPPAGWDVNNPQNRISSGPVSASAGENYTHSVGDLHVRVTHGGNQGGPAAPEPAYYFRAWLSSDGGSTWQPLTSGPTPPNAVPNAPYASWWETQRGLDRMWIFNGANAPYSALARDAAGNTYFGYQASFGGGAITKFNSSGSAEWTAYTNSSGGQGSLTFLRMKVGPDNAIYAAGAAEAASGSQGGMPDAWLAKFSPSGVKVWEKVVSGTEGKMDYFNDLVFDGAGNVIAGGGVSAGVITVPQGSVDDSKMLIAKYGMAAGALVSSTTYKPASVMVGPADLAALALDGLGNLYAGGSVSALVGSATLKLEKDAVIAKFSASTLEKVGPDYIYSNPQAMDPGLPLELAAPGVDFINSLQYFGGNLYAAGQRNRTPLSADPVFWVAKMPVADLSAISSVTYNSQDGLDASAYQVVLSTPTGALYVSGYENRYNPMVVEQKQKNILLRKYNLSLVEQWGKSLDGSYQNESVKAFSFETGADGYFYLAGLFNAWTGGYGDEGNPGLIRLAEPQTGLIVEQGYKPCSVRLAWIADTELPMGTTFYVQHATHTAFTFSAAAAQYSFVSNRMVFNGEYVSSLVAGLDAGNGANGMDTPPHHFRMGYSSATASFTPITGSTSAVPNTPGVWDRMDRYPNGNLFVVNNAHGGKNPLVRDAAGNVYTAGTFNTWGSNYVAYVRKFSSAGQPVWTRFYADQYDNSMPVINDLALDSFGNLYAAGQAGSEASAGYVNPGNMGGAYGSVSSTGKDALLIKYDAYGRMAWARTYDFLYNSDSGEDAALGVAVNVNGLYAAGYAYGFGGRQAFAAKINPATGVVDSSATIGAPNSVFNDVKLDASGNLYAVGASSNGASGKDMLIVKADSGLTPLDQFQLSDAGEDEAYALAIDTWSAGAPILYVAGEMQVDGQQDATLAKFSGAGLDGLWASTVAYNSSNENEDEALGVALDVDGVYVTGTEARYDINQAKNVFVRKYNTDGQLLWTQSLNSAGTNEDSAGGVAAAGREVFAAVDAGLPGMNYSYGPTAINGSGYFRHIQTSTNTTNPTLTVYVSTAQAAGSGVAGVRVAVMGFSQTGGIDPNGIAMDLTGAGGKKTFSLPAGKSYFVAISSHNMVPTIKDQLSDPGGNFFVDLNAHTTKQYYISPRSSSTADAVYRMTLNISTHTGTLAVGDYLMGEVFITQTGERVGYSVVRATDVHNGMEIYNLPAAANGVYGMAVSVPARGKVLQLFMDGAFPAVSAYPVAMGDASQLTGSFEVGASTVPPSIAGMVTDANWSPIEGARVRIERSTCAGDGYWNNNGTPGNPNDDRCNQWTMLYSKETLTDAGGGFSFYNAPNTPTVFCANPTNCTQRETAGANYSLNVGKAGYESGYRGFPLPAGVPLPYTGDMINPGNSTTFNLALATYTLTGVLKYNGMPLPNATIMVNPDWQGYSEGADSYRRCERGGCGIRTDARVRTGADGSFAIAGITDGNARIEAAFEGGWRSLNEGNDYESMSDNRRVTISSQGATVPAYPPNNGCRPGRVWVLDSSGTCKGFGSVAFNIIPEGANNAGQLYGSVTFVTTYTVTEANPLVISTSSPLTLMAQESCRDGCKNTQMSFTSLAGTFNENTTSYTMVLSTGVNYYTRIFSSDWAQANSFKSEVEPSTTVPAIRQDFSVLRAGGLHGVIKLPDGTSFKPSYGDENSPSSFWAQVVVEGDNVDAYEDRQLDEYGEFDFPNLAPGIYTVFLRPQGAGFVWAPARQTVTVSEGKTTEVKLQLETGLAVQPQIFGLPEISTASWSYAIIGVPSGTEMNQKKVTDLFFSDPEYAFEYSTSTGWQTKYMPAGQYDFYLILGASYDPGGGDRNIVSYQQFGNFIGRVKGVAVQKSDVNPNIGTAEQPIAVNILGSIGQGSIAGTMQGASMFTDADLDRMFGNFEELFGVIPAMMLYDSAGDLRGFSNGMPGTEASFLGFEGAMMQKDKVLMRSYLDSNALDYGVWGLPPGRYTAVFNNPNYPPVAKEITLPLNSEYVFNFDDQQIVTAGISGVVRSSAAPNAPLEGARVYLKHRTVEKFTLTNSSGIFTFSNLPTGIYRLEVGRNGYVTEGQKTSVAADESKAFTFYMLPSESKISGRVFLSKFPTQVSKAGVQIVAYDETRNVEAPESYLPKTEVQTDSSGNFEITGVVPGHLYKLSAFYTGKLPEVLELTAEEGNTVISDVTLKDIPPQITIKVKKAADSANKVDVVIKSPKALMSAPSCRYNPGQVFDADSAVTLALVPGPNRTYLGQFTVSSSQEFYTVKVTAGDAGNKMEKLFVYDQVSNAKTEQYIQQESLAGGAVQMDKETEEYSGIELDPGALSYSTTTETTDYANLVGGFFSALPSVRTVKTAKGNLTIADAVKNLMASEVYNMDLSNASANKPFTLTLKYDKERGAASANSLRIYQQDADGNWQEVPGNYTVDPMLGVLSVDISGLTNAYAGTSAARTPLGRKRAGMSAVVNGRYRPSAAGASQSGRFAVLTAPPIVGTTYAGSDFDAYNLPNPFSLKNKNVTLSADALGSAGAYATRGTVIKYHLPAGRTGSLKFVIYNVAGEKVRSFNMGSPGAGKVHYFEWDGKNETNQDCASGVYFLMAFMDGKRLGSKAHKMAIIK